MSKYLATGYYIINCPTCEGWDDEANIIFVDEIEDFKDYCYSYKLDKVYHNEKLIGRFEYDLGFHRISNVKLCEVDKYYEADENKVIKEFGKETFNWEKRVETHENKS